MITWTDTVTRCGTCGALLARDHGGTICSPCRRTQIERAARCGSVAAKESSKIRAVFDAGGVYGVADELGCDPVEALDVVLNARLVPFVSAQRRAALGSSSRCAVFRTSTLPKC